MTARMLTEALTRVEAWPEAAQEELAAIALEIDAALNGRVYHASAEELHGIDRGLASAAAGHIAPPDAVAAVFAKHRPA